VRPECGWRTCRRRFPALAVHVERGFPLNSMKGCNSSLVNGCAHLAASCLRGSEYSVKFPVSTGVCRSRNSSI
jgi:hypothetical protein